SLSLAVHEVLKVEARPMGIGGGTVAALFRRAGFHAAVWSKMEESAHQPNEFCHIQDMVDVSKVLCHVCVSG
ncbi:MAG: M20 family metallo-hydrolase, partial [Armatimonadetes bacterium]|nr:M20 family metallo-hydrolase [Armatimonadota bacterium]